MMSNPPGQAATLEDVFLLVGRTRCHAGRFIVTGGQDKKLVVWEVPSMKVQSQTSTDKKIVSVVIDPTGNKLIFAEKAGDVFGKLLDPPDSKSEHLLGHISSLTDMALSPSGTRLLTADRDEKIRISYYPHTFEIDAYCLGHTELVTSMCVFEDEHELVLSGGADGTLRLWQVADGALLSTLEISVPSVFEAEEIAPPQETASPQVDESLQEAAKKKCWDHMAAGTAQGTAAVSGRLRGKCEAAPVVAVAQCGDTASASLRRVFAAAVEHSCEVHLVSIEGSSTEGRTLKRVGSVVFSAPPVGLACVSIPAPATQAAPEGAEGMLIAATLSSQGSSAKLEACWMLAGRGGGGEVLTQAVEEEAEGKAPLARGGLVAAIGNLSRAIQALADEGAEGAEGAGAEGAGRAAAAQGDQYLQKRRRHTEPGWKERSGKNPKK
jgi:hypothetical protein